MSAGKPTLDLEYNEVLVDGYTIYLDQSFSTFEDEVTIDLVGSTYYQKLRISGVQVC